MTVEYTNGVLRTTQTEQEAVNPVVARLLKRGFIRRVYSLSGGEQFELTPAGHQYVADYEALRSEYEDVSILRSLSLQELQIRRAQIARVSLIIPALNEARNIGILLPSIEEYVPGMSEIMVVNGTSTDGTDQIAQELGATVLSQLGTGKGDALRRGFTAPHIGDIIVIMDADGSNRAQEIPALVNALAKKGVDIAKGSRFLKGGGSTDLTRIRRIGNKVFVSLVNLIWGGDYTDLCYGFMAFRREALERLIPVLESNYFQIEAEICIKAKKLGLKVVEVPSVELKRRHGESKLRGARDSFQIFKAILSEAFGK